MVLFWFCSLSSVFNLSIFSSNLFFSASCFLRMLAISVSTCFMKIATFFLHQRQSSLQLGLSCSVSKDYRLIELLIDVRFINKIIVLQQNLMNQMLAHSKSGYLIQIFIIYIQQVQMADQKSFKSSQSSMEGFFLGSVHTQKKAKNMNPLKQSQKDEASQSQYMKNQDYHSAQFEIQAQAAPRISPVPLGESSQHTITVSTATSSSIKSAEIQAYGATYSQLIELITQSSKESEKEYSDKFVPHFEKSLKEQ